MSQHSTMVPAASASGYEAARRRAAIIDRSHRARIVVSGADRASYLQGLLTNDVVALKPGEGCYAAYLTAQGRMIADLWVYELGDVMLLTLERGVRETVLAKFDQFIFSEDVQLGDVTDTVATIGVVGPKSSAVLSGALGIAVDALDGLREHGNVRMDYRGSPAIVTRTSDAGEPGFDVHLDPAQLDVLRSALDAAGVVSLDDSVAEAIRIETGVPRFQRDMDEETIPLEAGIESRAISFTKGCYVGQEVVIRVLHRGHGRVARRLVGIRVGSDAAPAAGTLVRAGEREIGHVTSAAISPALSTAIALGYVHRDFVEPGTRVRVGEVDGEVVALPFVAARD